MIKIVFLIIWISSSLYNHYLFPIGMSIVLLWIGYKLLFSGVDSYKLKEGVFVSSIEQKEGKTYVNLSDGSHHLFNSTNVTVAGNHITVN